MIKESFHFSLKNLSEQSIKIKERLLALKASKRETTNSLLLLEEVFVRISNNISDSDLQGNVYIKRTLGDISLVLNIKGEEFNPFSTNENANENEDESSEDFLRDMIFQANRNNLSYSHQNGVNVITIRVHQAGSRSALITTVAMILGIAAGIGLRFLPESAANFISNDILKTIQTIFMNALSMMLAPVVFFSISTSLSHLSGGKEIGRIGGKTLGIFLISSLTAIVLAILVSYFIFPAYLPNISEIASANSEVSMQTNELSPVNFIINLIPKNLISPILNGNMIQIILAATLIGIAMSSLKEKCERLSDIFDEANALFQKIVSIIINIMPLIAFSSMAMLIKDSPLSSLLSLLLYLVVILLCAIILFFISSLHILIFGHVSPLPYIRKTPGYLLTPFLLISSSACIPLSLNFSKQKLGSSEKISSFVIPLGATINMTGTCVGLICSAAFLITLHGYSLNIETLLRIGLMTFFMAIGTPGIPNSGIVCLSTIIASVGLPIEIIGILMGIWQILDRISTTSNVNGDIATAVAVSASEKALNMEIYKS